MAVSTNWAKFAVEVKLSDNAAKEELHLPCCQLSGEATNIVNGVVVFRPCANKIAVLCVGDQAFIDKVSASAVVSHTVAESSRAV